jgi:hypothetical protein
MNTSLAPSSRRAEPGARAGLQGPVLVTAAAMLVFVGSWLLLHRGFYARGQIVDTPIYQNYGELMVDGKIPYRDFALEYPPGALVAFVLPSLGASHRSAADYRHRFEVLMVLCGCAAIVAMALALGGLGVGTRAMAASLGFAALTPLLLGPVIQTRFDLLPAALAVAGVAAFVRDRPRFGFAFLGVGAAVKFFPAVILPLALAYVWRRRGRGEALVGALVFAAILAAALVPFALNAAARHGLHETVRGQLERPLQIESLGAAALVAAHDLWGVGVRLEYSHGSQNLAGATPHAFATALSALQALALVAIWAWFALRRRSGAELVAASAGAVAAFVAFGKVLSPQFLVWLVPLVPLVRGRRGVVASAILAAALVLTQLWFPRHYWAYSLGFAGRETALVVARDLLLVVLALVLVVPWPLRRPLPGRWPRGAPEVQGNAPTAR